MRKNIFRDFLWERDGNGNYTVTCLCSGKTLTAIPRLDRKGYYCIAGSQETEQNAYGQTFPKRYNKFEVMAYLKTEV